MPLKTVLKSLLAGRWKSFLVFLSLFVTILSIFLVSAISNGVVGMYSSMLREGGDIIITQSGIADTFFSDVDRKLAKKIAKIAGVKQVRALIVGASPVGDMPIVAVYGVGTNLLPKYRLVQGRYPKRGEVLLGSSIAKELGKSETVQIAGKSFKVSGIYASRNGFENGGVVMRIEDAGDIFHKSASMLLVDIDLKADAKRIIPRIEALSPKIAVKTTDSFTSNYNQFKIIKKSSLVISGVAFVMGLIAIASILSVTVMQRREEFGILKAIGIGSKRIAAMILTESLLLTFLAYLCAYGAAVLLLDVIRHIDSLHGYVSGEIDPVLAFWVFVASVAMSTLGSLAPLFTALRVDPATLVQKGN